MQNHRQTRVQPKAGKKTGIWLALLVALGLHALILLLPSTRKVPPAENIRAQIELQLTTFSELTPAPQVPLPTPEIIAALPAQMPEPPKNVVKAQPETEPAILAASLQPGDSEHDPEKMSEPAKRRLTNSILARQFISEESEADNPFHRQFEQFSSEPQKEFHYPARQDMIAMLDKPMPEVPFDYTPGLVNFAYDPGVKGDLQRFWDVITPEFGWRTNNGTEFKCIWVLIVVGCGWK